VESLTILQRILSSSTRCGHDIAYQVLNLLSKMLNKRYPTVEDITESKLLEWKMWPSFLGIIGM